jgi:hypothetical protein
MLGTVTMVLYVGALDQEKTNEKTKKRVGKRRSHMCTVNEQEKKTDER